MVIELRSPFRNPLKITKSGTYPTVVKLTNGKFFSTWLPELLGISATECDTTTTQGQMDAYQYCAPVNSIVNKQADALKNGRFLFTDAAGNETKPPSTHLAKLITQPNPVQNFKQFMAQAYAFMKVHGIAYCLPVYGITKTEPSSLWVIPNFMVTPEYTGKVFSQTQLSDIVQGYRVQGMAAVIPAEDMLVFRDSTISNNQALQKWIVPLSRLAPVKDQINSVLASTDAWLTISKRKGVPLGIISSGAKDSTSSIPLTPQEKQEAHDELNQYGLSGDNKKFVITSASLNYQQIGLPVRDLMLLEGIEANSRHISNAFNYPFELLSYTSNASLANGGEIKEAEKRHYTNQIIPDAEGICDTINRFFNLTAVTLKSYFDHLEVFQKSKEETGRALLTLTTGLDKAYIKRAITLEEYRAQVAVIMDIDPDTPNGKTYYNGEITATPTATTAADNTAGESPAQSGQGPAN